MKRRKFVNRALSTVAIIGSNSVAQSISAMDSHSIETRRGQRDIAMTSMDTQQSHILTLDEILTLPNVPADHRVSYGSDPVSYTHSTLPPI